MSESARTLIRRALAKIGALAPGETPTSDEEDDALLDLKIMLRHWSADNIRLYFTTKESFNLTGATYYTIGTGGTFNTARPSSIRGAVLADPNGIDYEIDIIDEKRYREISMKGRSGVPFYLWYLPEFPLGKIYFYPLTTGTITLDSLKPLTEPAVITSDISFPPEYDEAIIYNLAIRLSPEYGKPLDPTIAALAVASMKIIEEKNFSSQLNTTRPEILRLSRRYNIDEG